MYDELISALRFCDGGECDGCCRYTKDEGHSCYTLLRDAADAIEELSKPRWIPVTERLPEERKYVLCKCRADIIDVLRFENAEWYHDPTHVYMYGFVTHWMPLPPLPEPPKVET